MHCSRITTRYGIPLTERVTAAVVYKVVVVVHTALGMPRLCSCD